MAQTMRTFYILLITGLWTLLSPHVQAKDYQVADWGICADGISQNTHSIQQAIDQISAAGGGRLIFPAGRYLTGSIYLKSGVTLHLERGAVLLGSANPLDYDVHNTWPALVFSLNQKGIGITGQGEINGQGWTSANNVVSLIHRGLLKDTFRYDRPDQWRHQNIYFLECEDITIRDITLRAPGSWTNTYERCKNVSVEGLKVDGNSFWNNDGIDIVDCDGVTIRNCWFDAADDVICFKSHHPDYTCQNVVVDNCVGRSSANGVKFGTVSRGGFKNFKITNITIYNTYRSAVTFAAVDGAEIENIEVDGLRAINTGNIFFFVIGNRWSSGKKTYMRDITISNVYAEVPLGKPDPGYPFEGPIEDLPRNVSPSSIVGMPDIPIERMTLRNIEIVYPGDGDPFYAHVGTTPEELSKVPERPDAYPEFSMFKELPAWGFYIRHAKDITFDNVSIKALRKDYRVPIVLDDVHGITFRNLKITEPEPGDKEQIVSNRSSDIHIEEAPQ